MFIGITLVIKYCLTTNPNKRLERRRALRFSDGPDMAEASFIVVKPPSVNKQKLEELNKSIYFSTEDCFDFTEIGEAGDNESRINDLFNKIEELLKKCEHRYSESPCYEMMPEGETKEKRLEDVKRSFSNLEEAKCSLEKLAEKFDLKEKSNKVNVLLKEIEKQQIRINTLYGLNVIN